MSDDIQGKGSKVNLIKFQGAKNTRPSKEQRGDRVMHEYLSIRELWYYRKARRQRTSLQPKAANRRHAMQAQRTPVHPREQLSNQSRDWSRTIQLEQRKPPIDTREAQDQPQMWQYAPIHQIDLQLFRSWSHHCKRKHSVTRNAQMHRQTSCAKTSGSNIKSGQNDKWPLTSLAIIHIRHVTYIGSSASFGGHSQGGWRCWK